MTKSSLRIVYMGTPDFAVCSLRKLVEEGYNVVAVVTMPDKPSGRGHKVQFSPVKQYALSVGLPVLQPMKLKDELFVEELRSYKADLQIVVAFRMLPEVVWAMPRLGTFNLHASLLPQYRGAAPINWAVINGDTQTGITTFFLKHDIDTGDMILQERTPIAYDENVGSVHDRLMVMGAELVKRTIDLIIEGNVKAVPQPVLPAEQMRPAPKIFKETCLINFHQPVERVYNFIRGLSPYPTAWCELTLAGEPITVKVYSATVYNQDHNDDNTIAAGTVSTDGKHYLRVRCQDGWIELQELQLAGKKRMTVKDMLNGMHYESA